MIKLKELIIIFIITFLLFISFNYHFDFLYPYYWLKDLLWYPVYANINDQNISLSEDFMLNKINSMEEEIDKLKELTNIENVLTEFDYLNATVIERNREYWFNTLTINKGYNNGIILDMAVIDSKGLIGRITSVRNNTSDIKLITTNDVNSKVSVVIKDSENIYGITKGYDSKNDLLKVIISDNKNILKGTKVETTGMGGIFPKGILVGEVEDVIKDSDDVGNIVLVKLASDIKDVQYVSVIQRKEISNN